MGVLLMPRAAAHKPLSAPDERLVLPQITQLPGRGRALLALRANIGAAGFAGYRGWIGPNPQLTQATWHARRYEGRAPSPCCKLPLWNSM